ncbi:MAG: hypothetical protein M3448_07025 [Pseudomonadota bacterium]|nr:hypothetical protein [Pseudomonadota bacterium]
MIRLARSTPAITADAIAIAAITILSAAPYVTGLGFYSDDWTLLAFFHGLAAAGEPVVPQAFVMFGGRPVQAAYLASLFVAFGLEPLGHHLVNTSVIAGGVVLLYLLLLRLSVARTQAFASALLFALLPQLSTVRVWYATFQIPLALVLALLSMHALLSFAKTARPWWLAAAIGSALLSLGAYEIFTPAIAAFATILAFSHVREARGSSGWPWKATAAVAVVAALAAGVLFKLLTSSRTGPVADLGRYWDGAVQLVRPDYDWRVDSSLNIFAAASVHFWHTIRGWAEAVAQLLTGQLGAVPIIVTLAIALAAFWRLTAAKDDRETAMTASRLLLLGLAAFVVGHAAFLIVPWISFSPAGMANRVLVAAAIGVAIIFVAALAFATRLAAPRHRKKLFAISVSALALCASARIAQIGEYWAQAPALQRQVLDSARDDLRAVPAGSTIILDGVCPYHGPAVVFETYWGIGPALSLATGKQLSADAVSPRMSLTPSGLLTSMYEHPSFYPFGPGLFVYNFHARRLVPMPDAKAARDYFAGAPPRPACPRSYVAHGVLI